MAMQLTKPAPHKAVVGGDSNMEEWVLLRECDGCRVFVRPTSYLLMDPEERDTKWEADAKAGVYPAALWVETFRAIAPKSSA
ncbi:hypothetical protein GCM10025857_68180 [Alicyclobacillus contaminans]|nr:hypothetical protein GCM10025857_33720 [Alicyclobacillus contaminans]GMA55437.1 hypothetical protein GCM10025857_67940 [Alicyclobacillus contaminans]GMA55461.1 hypothetical protein GCM10025857_68180 [Alicyclobacillus contaminans]